LSYGPIGSIPWLSSGGGGEEGKQNMGDAIITKVVPFAPPMAC